MLSDRASCCCFIRTRIRQCCCCCFFFQNERWMVCYFRIKGCNHPLLESGCSHRVSRDNRGSSHHVSPDNLWFPNLASIRHDSSLEQNITPNNEFWIVSCCFYLGTGGNDSELVISKRQGRAGISKRQIRFARAKKSKRTPFNEKNQPQRPECSYIVT